MIHLIPGKCLVHEIWRLGQLVGKNMDGLKKKEEEEMHFKPLKPICG